MYRVNIGAQRGIGNVQIKSTPLMVNGVLYFTVPDHVWAVDARTGEELWHYDWVDQGGHLVGNRGVGMYGNWLYFMAPDGWFISLNAKDGKERWRKKVADEKLQYFTTMAPLVVAITSSSASAAMPWMSRVTSNRAIPKPATCSGAGIASRAPANLAPKPGPTRPPWSTAAA